MDWGNILRAAGNFDDATQIPARLRPRPAERRRGVNIAVVYIERFARKPAVEGQLLTALGALSDYLAWTSAGGPYDQLIPKTKRALAQTGDADDVPSFEACLNKALAAENSSDPEIARWQAAASFKLCVDGAIDRVNRGPCGPP